MRETRLSEAMANDALDAGLRRLDGGRVEIRSGAKPTRVSDPPTDGVVLSEHPLRRSAFHPASGRAARAQAVGDDLSVTATARASWFRAYGPGDVPEMDGTVGEAKDQCNLTVDDADFKSGTVASITDWTVTFPDTGR